MKLRVMTTKLREKKSTNKCKKSSLAHKRFIKSPNMNTNLKGKKYIKLNLLKMLRLTLPMNKRVIYRKS